MTDMGCCCPSKDRPLGPLVIGHRGYAAIAPENTLASFRAAIATGVEAAECDVHCTADGHVVLLHDATLDRTTDRNGAVAELTLAQVREADAGAWKGEPYRGERVPTLAETLELVRGKLHLIVEVKAPGIADRLVAAIRAADALRDVTVISFNAETCRQVRALEPTLPVGLLTGGITEEDPAAADELLRTALSLNAQFLSVAASGLKRALLQRARLCGMALWVWTVNDPEEMRAWAEMGVSAITSDDPGLALRVLACGGA